MLKNEVLLQELESEINTNLDINTFYERVETILKKNQFKRKSSFIPILHFIGFFFSFTLFIFLYSWLFFSIINFIASFIGFLGVILGLLWFISLLPALFLYSKFYYKFFYKSINNFNLESEVGYFLKDKLLAIKYNFKHTEEDILPVLLYQLKYSKGDASYGIEEIREYKNGSIKYLIGSYFYKKKDKDSNNNTVYKKYQKNFILLYNLNSLPNFNFELKAKYSVFRVFGNKSSQITASPEFNKNYKVLYKDNDSILANNYFDAARIVSLIDFYKKSLFDFRLKIITNKNNIRFVCIDNHNINIERFLNNELSKEFPDDFRELKLREYDSFLELLELLNIN